MSMTAVHPFTQVKEKEASVLEQVNALGSKQGVHIPLLSELPLKQVRQSLAVSPLQEEQELSHLMIFPPTEEYPPRTVVHTLTPLGVIAQMLHPGSQAKTPPDDETPPLKPPLTIVQLPLEKT